MKLGKKTVVTIGVLLSALLCVNMILYTPASADGNTKLKTSKNDISSETVNMHQGVSTSYAQIVQTYSDEYSVSLYSDKWKKFKSHAEMVKNCQLEDEKIQRMSTNELFNVVMAYRDGAAAGRAAARRVPGRVYPVGLYLYAVLRR